MYEFNGIKFNVVGEVFPLLSFFKDRPVDIVRLADSDKVVVWVNCHIVHPAYKYSTFLRDSHYILELRALDGGGFSQKDAEVLAAEMRAFSQVTQQSLLFDRYKPTYRYLTTHDLSQPV